MNDQREHYADLIDAETWAFIDRTNSWYPPDTVDYPIARQREIYDAMCREFFTTYPQGVMASDLLIEREGPDGDIPVRLYQRDEGKARALILYFHGGGFVVGGLESHDDVCAELCDQTGCMVASVDYRLCPEHPHPAAFDDGMAAFRWSRETLDLPLILAGDSAGGNVAAAVAHATRGLAGAAIGQVLIYPGLGGDITKGSYVTHADAPMLTTRDIVFYKDVRSGGRDVSRDASYAPLWDTDFSNLPDTVIVSAECDPISDDGRDYRDAIVAADGKAEWHNETGLVHGYLRARHSVERARHSFARIVAALNRMVPQADG